MSFGEKAKNLINYCLKIFKSNSFQIDWNMSGKKLHDFIRGNDKVSLLT